MNSYKNDKRSGSDLKKDKIIEMGLQCIKTQVNEVSVKCTEIWIP